MQKTTFESWKPGNKLLFTAFIAFGIFLIVFTAGLLLSFLFFDVDLSTFQTGIYDNISILRYFQGIQAIGLFVIPPFILALMSGVSVGNYLHINKAPKGMLLLASLAIMPIATGAISLLAYINGLVTFPDWVYTMEESSNILIEKMLVTDSITIFLANIFVIAIIPAIGEELIFRGILQKYFIQWTKNIHAGVIITAIVFSTIHFQFLGFLPRAAMGITFGYMLVYSKNIWYPIIAHFINNAVAVTIIFIDPTQSVSPTNNDTSVGIIVLFGVISLAIVSAIIIWFKHINQRQITE